MQSLASRFLCLFFLQFYQTLFAPSGKLPFFVAKLFSDFFLGLTVLFVFFSFYPSLDICYAEEKSYSQY